MGPDATTSRPATLEADAGVETDPGFTDAQRADFSLPSLLVSLVGALIALAVVNLIRRDSVR